MRTIDCQRTGAWLLLVACACSGSVSGTHQGSGRVNGPASVGLPGGAGNAGAVSGAGGAGVAGQAASPGAITVPDTPFAMKTATAAVRKVKNLLTGLAPTDSDVAMVTASGAAGLQELISTWITDPMYQPHFRDKMVFFLRNTFEQTGFTPTEDFKPQLYTPPYDLPTLRKTTELALKLPRILQDHYNSVLTQNRNMATIALRSTFVLACESPTSVSVGL